MLMPVARAFQVKHLDNFKLNKLHELEQENDRYLTPWEINSRFRLREHGGIDEGVLEKATQQVMAIYNKYERQILDEDGGFGMEEELETLHQMDKEILRAGLQFGSAGNGGISGRVSEARAQAEASPF